MSLTQISLDAGMLDRLDAVAAQRSLSREDALREAVENYLEEARQIAAIEEGVREADAVFDVVCVVFCFIPFKFHT